MQSVSQPEWSQTRVFSDDFSQQWFFRFLNELVIPFRNNFPGSPFWFTRYRCPENFDIGADELNELRRRSGFIQSNQHISLRFRFASDNDKRKFLKDEIGSRSHFWTKGIETYDFTKGFAEPRFSASERLERAKLVANLFHSNCLLILDLFEHGNGNYEVSTHNLNVFCGNPGQSVLHILANVYGRNDSSPVPLYWNSHSAVPIAQA
jgi:hypothetical protein